jgi:hypothetical protein
VHHHGIPETEGGIEMKADGFDSQPEDCRGWEGDTKERLDMEVLAASCLQ